MNIWSGSKDWLGAALTNPTEISRRKGNSKAYPVVDNNGKRWPDAEAAYKALRTGDTTEDIRRMSLVIRRKLRDHPELVEEIDRRGGRDYLKQCSHHIPTGRPNRWEGGGMQSAFIQALVAAYDLARSP